jgi:hypothetical protein
MPKPNQLQLKLMSALATELGTYQPPGSALLPAIHVILNIDRDPPRDWQIVGLECLLHRSPQHAPKALFQGVADLYQWQVELVQHDRSKSLENAIELLFCHFQRIKILSHAPQSEEMFEQCKIALPGQQYFAVMS